MNNKRRTSNMVIPTIIMAVVLYIVRSWHVLLLGVVGIVVYALVLYAMRGFSRQEIERIALSFFR